MITEEEIIKLKFAFLAHQVCYLKEATKNKEVITLLGEALSCYTHKYPSANYLYDTIVLLDELLLSSTPKKVLDHLYVQCNKGKKEIEPVEFANFHNEFMQSVDLTEQEFTALYILKIHIFALLYQGVYTGQAGRIPSLAEDVYHGLPFHGDVLSCTLLVQISYALLYGCFSAEVPRQDASVEFRGWFLALGARKEAYYIDVLKYLCGQWKEKHIFGMLGMNNKEDIVARYQNEKQNMVQSHKLLKNPQRFANSHLDSLLERYAQNLYGWNPDKIIFAVFLSQNVLNRLLEYCRSSAIRNAACLFYAPRSISCSPWSDYEYQEPEKKKKEAFIYKYFFECICPPDILRKRRFFMNVSGIYMFFEPVFLVESMYVTEVHKGNLHYIWATAKIPMENQKPIYRNYMLPIENIGEGIKYLEYCSDYNVLLLLLNWLDLDLEQCTPASYTDEAEALTSCFVVKKSEFIKSMLSHGKITYYRTKTTKDNREDIVFGTYLNKCASEYVIEMKEIGEFIRRLPAGQNASDEAIQKARKFYIDLPRGYTFVSGFTREQRVLNKRAASEHTFIQ